MSNIKVENSPVSQAPSVTPPGEAVEKPAGSGPAIGAATGAATGALGLGVDVGVLSDVAVGETYTVEAEQTRDTFDETPKDTDEATSKEPRPRGSRDARRAANPFRALPRQPLATPPRIVARAAVPVDIEADLPLPVLQKLAEAEARLGPERVLTFSKVRQGNLLLTADGQAVRARKAPVDSEGLTKLARKMVSGAHDEAAAKNAAKQFAKAQARFLKAGKMDIQSYVQRVLRESYQVQNELLHDYAEKVKFYNEQKKKVREQLQDGRATLARWRTEEKGLDGFIAKEPFLALEMGKDGEWTQPTMTEADVSAWHAAVRVALENRQGSDDVGMSYGLFFSSESRLGRAEQALVETALTGQNAAWLEEHSEEVIAAVALMNRDEFQKYVIDGGMIYALRTPLMESVKRFMQTLSPVAALYWVGASTLANPFTAPHTEIAGLVGGDIGEVGGATVGAVAGGSFAAQGATIGAALGPIGALIGGIVGTIGGALGAGIGTAVGASVGDAFAMEQNWLNGFDLEQQAAVDESFREIYTNAAAETGLDWDGELTRDNAARFLDSLEAKYGGMQNAFGNPPKVGDPKTFNVPNQLDAYLESLDERLNQIGDDAQLATVDLQSALQKQQQTLQMLTNIGKMLHDTAMAIIRKSGQ